MSNSCSVEQKDNKSNNNTQSGEQLASDSNNRIQSGHSEAHQTVASSNVAQDDHI
ncbi:MAG TPA: hypothetical protein V6C89_17790 [Drouetiella sp.]